MADRYTAEAPGYRCREYTGTSPHPHPHCGSPPASAGDRHRCGHYQWLGFLVPFTPFSLFPRNVVGWGASEWVPFSLDFLKGERGSRTESPLTLGP